MTSHVVLVRHCFWNDWHCIVSRVARFTIYKEPVYNDPNWGSGYEIPGFLDQSLDDDREDIIHFEDNTCRPTCNTSVESDEIPMVLIVNLRSGGGNGNKREEEKVLVVVAVIVAAVRKQGTFWLQWTLCEGNNGFI